ncbi:MAG: dihydroxyacetone kinase subunit DhaL [Desulfuromonadales bacterium]|nr:dihydroxyacetone kinase subunit DhaL [Desulfuromonadales bacterium]
MNSVITAAQMHGALIALCDTIEQEKDYLSELDGATGDGDHGVNMAKCFRGVKAKLEAAEKTDVGAVLGLVGLEVMNSVGGAMGALYGTMFINLSSKSSGKGEVGLPDLATMFTEALDGILAIGKAKVGDKTLVDTLAPAVAALEQAAREKLTLTRGLEEFASAAHRGMESTKDLMAKMGRASRLGERSIGHIDAGATSCYLILNAFASAGR